MTKGLRFRGIIRNVSYDPRVRTSPLKQYPAGAFDINAAATTGIVTFDEDTSIGYARWTAPKRTRTYALTRTYNVYHLPKKAVVIPIIKDEGYQTNNDRINFITFSWMNLSNVYIILSWYDDASAHPKKPGRITRQRLNADFVRERFAELRTYQQTALHWNTMHFTRDFERVYRSAVHSYEQIAARADAVLVSSDVHLAQLTTWTENGKFSLDRFQAVSLPKSYQASQREMQTDHALEYLSSGSKAYFSITNWLGGEYHLTSDEVYISGDEVIIQESKNTSRDKLPKLSDIQDGLFKLILFANLDELYLNQQQMRCRVRLKLTGNLLGSLTLPADTVAIEQFAEQNQLRANARKILKLLDEEARANPKLEIEVTPNA